MERICWICFTIGRSRIRLQDERKPPGSPESQVDVPAVCFAIQTRLPRASEGFIKQFMARMRAKTQTVLLSESCGQSVLRGSAECSRGFPHGWLHPFPAFSVLPSDQPDEAWLRG